MKLTQRIQTHSGPRTTVVQGLSREAAYAMMHATAAAGGEAVVTEDGMQINMTAFLRGVRVRRKIKLVTPLRA